MIARLLQRPGQAGQARTLETCPADTHRTDTSPLLRRGCLSGCPVRCLVWASAARGFEANLVGRKFTIQGYGRRCEHDLRTPCSPPCAPPAHLLRTVCCSPPYNPPAGEQAGQAWPPARLPACFGRASVRLMESGHPVEDRLRARSFSGGELSPPLKRAPTVGFKYPCQLTAVFRKANARGPWKRHFFPGGSRDR